MLSLNYNFCIESDIFPLLAVTLSLGKRLFVQPIECTYHNCIFTTKLCEPGGSAGAVVILILMRTGATSRWLQWATANTSTEDFSHQSNSRCCLIFYISTIFLDGFSVLFIFGAKMPIFINKCDTVRIGQNRTMVPWRKIFCWCGTRQQYFCMHHPARTLAIPSPNSSLHYRHSSLILEIWDQGWTWNASVEVRHDILWSETESPWAANIVSGKGHLGRRICFHQSWSHESSSPFQFFA